MRVKTYSYLRADVTYAHNKVSKIQALAVNHAFVSSFCILIDYDWNYKMKICVKFDSDERNPRDSA